MLAEELLAPQMLAEELVYSSSNAGRGVDVNRILAEELIAPQMLAEELLAP